MGSRSIVLLLEKGLVLDSHVAKGRLRDTLIGPKTVPLLVSARVIFSVPFRLAPQKPRVLLKSILLVIGGRLKVLEKLKVSGENAMAKVALA